MITLKRLYLTFDVEKYAIYVVQKFELVKHKKKTTIFISLDNKGSRKQIVDKNKQFYQYIQHYNNLKQ